MAYPCGPDQPEGFCGLQNADGRPAGGAQWDWLVQWPERFMHAGAAATKQNAADAATAAWWLAYQRTEAAWAEHERGAAFSAGLLATGEADFALLDARSMSYDELMRVMTRLTRHWRSGTAYRQEVEAALAVLSDEFARRRIGHP